jgi:hypothetical protein
VPRHRQHTVRGFPVVPETRNPSRHPDRGRKHEAITTAELLDIDRLLLPDRDAWGQGYRYPGYTDRELAEIARDVRNHPARLRPPPAHHQPPATAPLRPAAPGRASRRGSTPQFAPGRHPALWVTERMGRLRSRSINEAFVAARDAAGLDPALDLHCLRHSYVTHLTEFGYPARFVQEQVGHTFASTTAIYTGVSDEFRHALLTAALQKRLGEDWTIAP